MGRPGRRVHLRDRGAMHWAAQRQRWAWRLWPSLWQLVQLQASPTQPTTPGGSPAKPATAATPRARLAHTAGLGPDPQAHPQTHPQIEPQTHPQIEPQLSLGQGNQAAAQAASSGQVWAGPA